eukprot:305975-Prymnesium_polylepis.1
MGSFLFVCYSAPKRKGGACAVNVRVNERSKGTGAVNRKAVTRGCYGWVSTGQRQRQVFPHGSCGAWRLLWRCAA